MQRSFVIGLLLLLSASAEAQPWQEAVDAFWGEGLPTEEKLHVFDTFWSYADSVYAAFHHLDIDWEDLRATYRTEVEAGVSRGRFAGIMNHLAMALREPHTYALDSLVNVQTSVQPGVPLLYGWVHGDNGHFGACLTPLPDSSLLVYAVVSEHPLGLQPGDIILGYDGIAWKKHYRELLAAALPLAFQSDTTNRYPWSSSIWGSAPLAYEHLWLGAAGMNWHLFQTVDVVEYDTGNIRTLSVAPLAGADMHILCTEQLPVAGVDFPDPVRDEYISWGILEGTRVGYIYVWSWYWGYPREAFREAVETLMLQENVDGLIIDFRFNHGGIVHFQNDGFALLFDTTMPTLGVAVRSDPDDHFAMEPTNSYVLGLDIPGDPATFFEKPIAVLTGPGAFSAGDYGTVRLGFHPHARIFGKSTSSSFAPALGVVFAVEGWGAAVSFLDAYRKDAPDEFLTHTERPVDERVWLIPEDVARGEDTVVKTALEWIAQMPTAREEEEDPHSFELLQNYPNPFTGQTTLEIGLPQDGQVRIAVYNVLGQEVIRLADGFYTAGRHTFTLETQNMASGIYVCVARFGDHTEKKTMLLVR